MAAENSERSKERESQQRAFGCLRALRNDEYRISSAGRRVRRARDVVEALSKSSCKGFLYNSIAFMSER